MQDIFVGLSAFPLTPATPEGIVDTETLAVLVDRLATACVQSVTVLGSTGGYPYLSRQQRSRAIAAAVEAASGRVPIIAGVSALRTDCTIKLARDAARIGADALLLAPMSYLPLTEEEVGSHYEAIAASTELRVCIYNNPGITNFTFSNDLIEQLSARSNLAAIKMPPAINDDFAAELRQLRARVPAHFKIGYSGDWIAAPALLAGADAWYSVVAGLLPEPAATLAHAARCGSIEQTRSLQAAFEPLWSLIKQHGSFRLLYSIADRVGIRIGEPPLPLKRLGAAVETEVDTALSHINSAIRFNHSKCH